MITRASAAALALIGLVVVVWAGYAFWTAAHGGAGDVTAGSWAAFGAVGLLVGVGFISIAWSRFRRTR
jgi:hypothetical protein